MKIISIAFLQDSEGSISDRLEFLSLTLKLFLANVKPYQVSNLELMINPVIFIPRFILCLTLLQLLPEFLVYLLDPLDELVGSVLYSFFIHIGKEQFKG